MNLVNPRIQSLKEMLGLEEKRISLQRDLDAIEQRMAALKDAIFSSSPIAFPLAKAKGPIRATSAKSSTNRTPRGLLKDKIMTALDAAGSAGVHVKDLAAALGTKAVNVHSWFHSNLKKNPAIKKVTGGHYILGGKSKAAPAPKKVAAKTAKAPKAKGKARGSKRGELSSRILAELKSAGDKGISVTNLAAKLGAKYKNIYIWFATTGKKNEAVKKVGPATYKLVS